MSLLIIKDHPLTGVGYSMDTPANHDFINHEALRLKVPEKIRDETAEYNNPHNSWLGLGVRVGLVGLFLFVWIFVVGVRICFAAIKQSSSHELRLQGQLCLSLIVLFVVYGFMNEVFMHLLEMLLGLSFALTASLSGGIGVSRVGVDVDKMLGK